MAQNSKENNITHFCGVALENPLNGFNIGASIRACGCFDASFLVASGTRFKERVTDFRNLDTEMTRKKIPVFLGVDNLNQFIPFDTDLVFIERGESSIPLHEFKHPRRAIYFFGPEDGSVNENLVKEHHKSHKVHIDTLGSLNLSAAVYITLFDRYSKKSSFMVDANQCPRCSSQHLKMDSEKLVNGNIAFHCNSCSYDFQVNNT